MAEHDWGTEWWQCDPDAYAEGQAWAADGLTWDQALARIMAGARAAASAAQVYGWHCGYVETAGYLVGEPS